MMCIAQIFWRRGPGELVLNLQRRFAGRQSDAIAETKNMRIDRDGGLAERRIEDDIGGLATHSRQRLQRRARLRHLAAECSLDLACPADEFAAFCDAHPDRVVVVYANTSAAVKARADWMVTSSIALPVVKHLMAQGKKILWAPDRHLGNYVQEQTGADMLLWQGSCIVHDEYKAKELAA